MKATAFSVRPYQDSKRPKLKFVVTGPLIQGKRWRRFFATKGEAEGHLQLKKVERENHGTRALEFPEALRVMAAEAAATLEPYGWTLRDAVSFCLPHLKAKHRSCTIEKAKDELLAIKQKDGASRRYVEDLRSRLGQMATAFPDKPLAEFTLADVDDWLRALPVAALTRNHFRRVASCLFAFGMDRGYCAGNPASQSAKAKTVGGAVGILSITETSRLLGAASVDLLPAIAIQAFAGLRRAEVERLDWKEIDLGAALLDVRADKAKTARRRLIKIQPNLSSWLSAHAKPAGAVAPVNYRVRLDEARTAAKIGAWPHNCLRHGFASYHLAHFSNAAELALELGHTNSALIFAHYRQVVKPKEAARYWNFEARAGQRGKNHHHGGLADYPIHENENAIVRQAESCLCSAEFRRSIHRRLCTRTSPRSRWTSGCRPTYVSCYIRIRPHVSCTKRTGGGFSETRRTAITG